MRAPFQPASIADDSKHAVVVVATVMDWSAADKFHVIVIFVIVDAINTFKAHTASARMGRHPTRGPPLCHFAVSVHR